jgi:proteic killer suppression protein
MGIKTIRGSATRNFVEHGKCKFPGLDVELANQRLNELSAASSLEPLGKLQSVGLHKLKGNLSEFWSINVNGPWRILFQFKEGNAYEVHITDPH